jgi:asparagine synthase (glutamine-hydrolysing)
LGIADVLTPALLERIEPLSPQRQQAAVWQLSQGFSLVDRMLAFDWRYTLAETDLPKVVGTARLAGLAVGFPMLDRDLLDFSLKLPGAYKLKRLKLRWFFKEALRGFLPDAIINKKKQGFGLPFGVWANRDAALKKLASESLDGLVERGILRAEFSQRLLTQRLPEHPGYYGEMIWILTMLEQWLQKHAPAYRVS